MGNSGSKSASKNLLISKESKTWGKALHVLKLNSVSFEALLPDVSPSQIQELDCFQDDLYLCYMNRPGDRLYYTHWFVSDLSDNLCRNIEFVPAMSASIATEYGYKVIISSEPRKGYFIAKEFKLTEEVKKRMRAVLGANNYSLVLRNSEHVARYIQCGAWISLQSVGTGKIGEIFKKELEKFEQENEDIHHLINTFPADLIGKQSERVFRELYKSNDYSFNIEYMGHTDYLTDQDNRRYSIVFLGPTGSGKSSLINLLFNKNVNIAKQGAMSVTKEVNFSKGVAFKHFGKEDHEQEVNIIDTIGFCDSAMSESEVYDAVKDKLQTNLVYIDRVVIVCSNRLEMAHQEAIKKYLEWLDYANNKQNFCFIYNKCDGMDEGSRLANLSHVCQLLKIDTTITNFGASTKLDTPVPIVNALGFDPKASFDDIKEDLECLHNAIVYPTYQDAKPKEWRRLEIESCRSLKKFTKCTIL